MIDKDFLENENSETQQDIILGEGNKEPWSGEEILPSDTVNDTVSVDDIIISEEIVHADASAQETDAQNETREADDSENVQQSDSEMAWNAENSEEDSQSVAFVPNPSDAFASEEQETEFGAQEADSRSNAARTRKKRRSVAGKVIGLVASAAVFGLIAGGTMVGLQKYATESGFLPKRTTTILGRGSDSSISQETTATNLVSTQSAGNYVQDVSGIVQSAMPSVVAINGKAQVTYESWFGQSQTYSTPTSGSGIIIGENEEELLIVTNNHVVEETSDLSVVFIDNSEVKAVVKGGDSNSDLAVIAVKLSDLSEETRSSISIAAIGNSDNVKVGEGVVAIGNALGYGQSVTQGIISAKDREIETRNGKTTGLIQTDAAINPGNSGGALLNLNGEVIGINSIKYTSTEVEGMGYAIPITTAENIIKDLSSRTLVDEENQGTLGIRGQDIDQVMSETYDIPQGVYVYRIVENGAAESSDLQEKDIITKIESYSVKSMEELKKRLSYYSAGDKVKLTIQRLDGSQYVENVVEITLGKKSDLIP